MAALNRKATLLTTLAGLAFPLGNCRSSERAPTACHVHQFPQLKTQPWGLGPGQAPSFIPLRTTVWTAYPETRGEHDAGTRTAPTRNQ